VGLIWVDYAKQEAKRVRTPCQKGRVGRSEPAPSPSTLHHGGHGKPRWEGKEDLVTKKRIFRSLRRR